MDDTELLVSSDQKMEDASTVNPTPAQTIPPSSDDSGESDSDSEDEAESNHQIETLESELSANPYNYDAYVQVIITPFTFFPFAITLEQLCYCLREPFELCVFFSDGWVLTGFQTFFCCQYIKLLRKTANLEKLRQAREAMSAMFPLSPSLWLEWARDEASLASR